LAAVGIFLKVFGGVRYKKASTAMYVAMGWMVLIAVRPLWAGVEPLGLVFLLAGGFAYTLGVPFYLARGLRYSHFVWHLFVLAGSVFHFFAVLWYSA
jgi:hemolysin III